MAFHRQFGDYFHSPLKSRAIHRQYCLFWFNSSSIIFHILSDKHIRNVMATAALRRERTSWQGPCLRQLLPRFSIVFKSTVFCGIPMEAVGLMATSMTTGIPELIPPIPPWLLVLVRTFPSLISKRRCPEPASWRRQSPPKETPRTPGIPNTAEASCFQAWNIGSPSPAVAQWRSIDYAAYGIHVLLCLHSSRIFSGGVIVYGEGFGANCTVSPGSRDRVQRQVANSKSPESVPPPLFRTG